MIVDHGVPHNTSSRQFFHKTGRPGPGRRPASGLRRASEVIVLYQRSFRAWGAKPFLGPHVGGEVIPRSPTWGVKYRPEGKLTLTMSGNAEVASK